MKSRSAGTPIYSLFFKNKPYIQEAFYTYMRLWCCGSQKQLDVEPFGPNLADVEKQIAAHNILHQAIQSYNTQLTADSIASPVRAHASITDGFSPDLSLEARCCLSYLTLCSKRTFSF